MERLADPTINKDFVVLLHNESPSVSKGLTLIGLGSIMPLVVIIGWRRSKRNAAETSEPDKPTSGILP